MLENSRKGFTLIELLIVVAIIAILAAIAVPNFLEAQTRAKVVRTIANQRNIATALEAYRIDNKGALPDYHYAGWLWAYRGVFYIGLSTPVAYMTGSPEDIFYRMYGVAHPDQFPDPYFYQYYLWDHNIIHAVINNPMGSAPGIWSDPNTLPYKDVYVSSLANEVDPAFHKWNHTGASYMLKGFGPGWPTVALIDPYDPSNGTMSVGSIYYFN